MQEFTVQTEDTEEKKRKLEKKRRKALRRKVKAKSDKFLKHNVNKSNKKPQEPKGLQLDCMVMLISGLCLIFAVAAAAFAYLYFREKQNENTSKQPENEKIESKFQKNNNSDKDTENGQILGETSNVPEHMQGKIIYSDSYNLYIAEKDGSEEERLTDFEEGNGVELTQFQIIDTKYIGLLRCNTNPLQAKCKIMLFDMNSDVATSLRETKRFEYVNQVNWADKDTYAYTVERKNKQSLTLRLVREIDNQGKSDDKVISTSTVKEKNSRQPFIEDSTAILFSPDNEKLLHIQTNARDSFDFNVYIYNSSGDNVDKIESATQPEWIHENKIIYRKYSNKSSGQLYTRNVEDKTSSPLSKTQSAAYNPKVLGDRVLYWENTSGGTVFMYNVKTKTNTKIAQGAAYPIWLSENEIIFARTKKCKDRECQLPGTDEYDTQFKIREFRIHDINTRQEIPININATYLKNGIATWNNKEI